MKLEEWLEGVRRCADEEVEEGRKILFGSVENPEKRIRLTADFGVHDNWPILCGLPFNKLLEVIEGLNKFKFNERFCNGTISTYDYIPGTVKVQVTNDIGGSYLTYEGYEIKAEPKITMHQEFQRKNFSSGIMFHPYNEKKMQAPHWTRAMAIAIDEVISSLKTANARLCLPKSIGWKYTDDRIDYLSRVVYWPDEDEERIMEEVRQIERASSESGRSAR